MEISFQNLTPSGRMLTLVDCDKLYMFIVMPRKKVRKLFPMMN